MKKETQYFTDWHKTGDDTKLKAYVNSIWMAYAGEYPPDYSNLDPSINDFIKSLIVFLELKDKKNKDIIPIVKKYVKHFFIRYQNENYIQDAKWRQLNYPKIQNKKALEHEVLLRQWLRPLAYDEIIKRWDRLSKYYKLDSGVTDRVKERLNQTIIQFVIDDANPIKDMSDIKYIANENRIVYELPVYFVKQQYEKYGELNKDDLKKLVNENKIFHEVMHILQQTYILSHSSKDYKMEENRNWEDITERAADRNMVGNIKQNYGEDDFNRFIEDNKKEYYNYLVNNKLGINFSDPNNPHQLNKLRIFIKGSIPFVNAEDVDKADFNYLMKFIKIYSEEIFENSEWYKNVKKHWNTVGMFDKDIPKEIWGKLRCELKKAANDLESYGMFKEAMIIDKLFKRLIK